MMVSTIATTPSVSAIRRSEFHLPPPVPVIGRSALAKQSRKGWLSAFGSTACSCDPLDQFVELDGLLGGGETVFGRKSVFAGALIRSAGGSG